MKTNLPIILWSKLLPEALRKIEDNRQRNHEIVPGRIFCTEEHDIM